MTSNVVFNNHKKKTEPMRTTKTNPKLVLFPDSGVDLSTFPDYFSKSGPQDRDDVPFDSLRRVSAYLVSESINLRELTSFLLSRHLSNRIAPKRYDEVLYTPFFIDCKSDTIYSQELEHLVASSLPIGEIFFFDYGVIVIWGLEELHELKLLNEFAPFCFGRYKEVDHLEIESFHFCQNNNFPPRLVNDIINLSSGHHMTKLTISHALAQSVKLAFFEGVVEQTIFKTKDIPFNLANNGSISMSRKSITKQIGELFVMRINVNLVSNVLDTPEIFWAEPTLCPLYKAVRTYLEISQRVDVLNQRCSVLTDLLDMLREHANHVHAEALEWIVIILISLEIFIGIFTIFIDLYYIKKSMH